MLLHQAQGTIFAADGPVPLSNTSASVTIIPSTLILLPGQTQTVVAVFKLPNTLDASTFPVFSGFIQLVGPTVSQTFHVSYLGLAGSLKNKQVIDDTDAFFGVPLPTLLDSAGDVQAGPTNYSFVGDDVPTLLWRFVIVSCIRSYMNFLTTDIPVV